VVHAYGTFPPEAEDNYLSFAVPPLLNEFHSPRNSFASEPDLNPNVDSGSCPEVAAVHTVLRAEIFERMEKLKVLQADVDMLKTFRKDAQARMDLNQQTDGPSTSSNEALDKNDRRLAALESKLARVLLEVESGLDTRYVALESIDTQCNELLQEVADLRAEVAGGREEVDSILTEVKKLAVDTEAAIKAHLVQVQRAREVDEASVSIPKSSRKRSFEDDADGDVTIDTEATNDSTIVEAEKTDHIHVDGEPQAATVDVIHVPSSSSPGGLDSSMVEQRPVKRARIEIVPSAAGVLAGAVAGGLLTWAGLAYY